MGFKTKEQRNDWQHAKKVYKWALIVIFIWWLILTICKIFHLGNFFAVFLTPIPTACIFAMFWESLYVLSDFFSRSKQNKTKK